MQAFHQEALPILRYFPSNTQKAWGVIRQTAVHPARDRGFVCRWGRGDQGQLFTNNKSEKFLRTFPSDWRPRF